MPHSIANQQPPPPPTAESAIHHAWQFQLRHLFGLMTISAIAAALIAAYGAGTLLTSAGLLIAWLNVCGAFERVQVGRRQIALVWLAWGAFLISLALPSLWVFGPVLGFWAAWYAVVLPFEAIRKGETMNPGLFVFAAINLANVLIWLLPLSLWRPDSKIVGWHAAVLCIVMVAPWCFCWKDSMLIGYYVWCASFKLALIAIPIRAWHLVAMIAATILVAMAASQPL